MQLNKSKFILLTDSMGLHRVENFSHTDPAVSLHLYCPPFDTCHMFDQRTGKKTQCKITFWSKYGEKLPTVQNYILMTFNLIFTILILLYTAGCSTILCYFQ
jgi:hypothetical protein